MNGEKKAAETLYSVATSHYYVCSHLHIEANYINIVAIYRFSMATIYSGHLYIVAIYDLFINGKKRQMATIFSGGDPLVVAINDGK